ncbi:hypothetical protein BS47DRAFT_1368139 [Hydnum rufescens UP504]|uniref:DUF4100 domain-containing protein n=1 Tax=Hydnum rufescens UP504 TaxID=1448309 RepID=A0A9P6AGU5_9AGAM|nr:hypothetical protein BS47DRAFT_1368139 [Hydnum rufescens UP504]
MGDGTKEERSARKQVSPRDGKGPLVPKSKDRSTKPTMEDVVIRDTKDQVKKRASPAYRFASELQENVNIEALFKALMDKEISLKLGDVFGSSFELCKRLQIASKTQRVPVGQDVVGSKSLEVTINSVERGVEPSQLGKRPRKPPLINCPPKKGDPTSKSVIYEHADVSTDDENEYLPQAPLCEPATQKRRPNG